MRALLLLLLVSTCLTIVYSGDVSVDQKQGVNIASEGESGGGAGSTAAPEPAETTAGGCNACDGK